MGCGTIKTSDFDSDDYYQENNTVKVNKKKNYMDEVSFDNKSIINSNINKENNKNNKKKEKKNYENNNSSINNKENKNFENNEKENKSIVDFNNNSKKDFYKNSSEISKEKRSNIILSNRTQNYEDDPRHYYIEDIEGDDEKSENDSKNSNNEQRIKPSSSSKREQDIISNNKTLKSCTVLSPGQFKLAKLVIETNNSIEEYTQGGPYFEIEVKANRFDQIYPIFIPDNQEIEFQVSGKWNINSNIACDSKGIPNNNKNKYNNGALLGRVIKGEEFIIYDGLKYISKNRGALVLKMYLDNIWDKEIPFGSLKLKIKGAKNIENLTELEEKIGWWKQLRIINFTNSDQLNNFKLSTEEKSFIIIINKIRHDSSLFTSQYLNNYQNLTPSTIKIYKQLIENDKKYIPLKVNLSIIKILQKFFKNFIDKENNIDDLNYIMKTGRILNDIINECFNKKKKVIVDIIKYYENDPFSLALRFLFNENNRNYLLDYGCEELSLITLNCTNKENKNIFYSIIVLSNIQGNDHYNYDFDMNLNKFIEKTKKDEAKHLKLINEITKNKKN